MDIVPSHIREKVDTKYPLPLPTQGFNILDSPEEQSKEERRELASLNIRRSRYAQKLLDEEQNMQRTNSSAPSTPARSVPSTPVRSVPSAPATSPWSDSVAASPYIPVLLKAQQMEDEDEVFDSLCVTTINKGIDQINEIRKERKVRRTPLKQASMRILSEEHPPVGMPTASLFPEVLATVHEDIVLDTRKRAAVDEVPKTPYAVQAVKKTRSTSSSTISLLSFGNSKATAAPLIKTSRILDASCSLTVTAQHVFFVSPMDKRLYAFPLAPLPRKNSASIKKAAVDAVDEDGFSTKEDWRIGDEAWVRRAVGAAGAATYEYYSGVITYTGRVSFATGEDWIGVQLTGDSVGKGRNDGTVQGVRYFDTAPDSGLFVRKAALRLLKPGDSDICLRGVIAGLENVKQHTACGKFALALTKEGSLYRIGEDLVPTLLDCGGHCVQNVKAGSSVLVLQVETSTGAFAPRFAGVDEESGELAKFDDWKSLLVRGSNRTDFKMACGADDCVVLYKNARSKDPEKWDVLTGPIDQGGDVKLKPLNYFKQHKVDIKMAAVGKEFGAVLDTDGVLYTWKVDAKAQKVIVASDSPRYGMIFASGGAMMAVDESGTKLWELGEKDSQTLLDLGVNGGRIASVAVGPTHCALNIEAVSNGDADSFTNDADASSW